MIPCGEYLFAEPTAADLCPADHCGYGDSALNLTSLADFDVRSIRRRQPPAALAGTAAKVGTLRFSHPTNDSRPAGMKAPSAMTSAFPSACFLPPLHSSPRAELAHFAHLEAEESLGNPYDASRATARKAKRSSR